MFMYGLNPQLYQLARTMVVSGNLEEVIKIVKKATVYGEKKVDHLKQKLKTNKNGRVGGKSGGKGSKGNRGPSGGPKGKVQIISGDSQQKSLPVL